MTKKGYSLWRLGQRHRRPTRPPAHLRRQQTSRSRSWTRLNEASTFPVSSRARGNT